ncbi:hypothetical protein PVAP13_J683274 [Panicum virgatum]|nr:hypothetical protein PVAP13_J683274 [Panicum virgatum]
MSVAAGAHGHTFSICFCHSSLSFGIFFLLPYLSQQPPLTNSGGGVGRGGGRLGGAWEAAAWVAAAPRRRRPASQQREAWRRPTSRWREARRVSLLLVLLLEALALPARRRWRPASIRGAVRLGPQLEQRWCSRSDAREEQRVAANPRRCAGAAAPSSGGSGQLAGPNFVRQLRYQPLKQHS